MRLLGLPAYANNLERRLSFAADCCLKRWDRRKYSPKTKRILECLLHRCYYSAPKSTSSFDLLCW